MSSEEVKEFKVNQYITLKLENNETILYLADKKFIQCRHLLLFLPKNKISSFDEIDSIDEASQELEINLEKIEKFRIPPKEEFWGHCSNLQTWAENDYDTRLLHRDLAFPLLRALFQLGDPIARKVFKEEIARRLRSKYQPVVQYLKDEGYLYVLNKEELETACLDYDKVIIKGKKIPIIGFDLDLRYRGISCIKEIEGLEHCIDLKYLDLTDNSITEIKGLENLINLNEMWLSNNKIKKIKGFTTSTKLKTLKLGGNRIERIEGLNKLINLCNLELNRNNITKINGLENLINLQSLTLSENKIEKIEGFQYLKSIENLKLNNNSIKKIEGLDSLKNLKTLDLSSNPITILEGLENLEILTYLGLKYTNIPISIIKDLGGYSRSYNVNNPKHFVNYCKQLKNKN